MQLSRFAAIFIASIVSASPPAMAQGAGGGSGGAAGAGSAGTGAATTAGTGSAPSASSNGSQNETQNDPNNRPAPQSSTAKTVADEQKAARSGANTVAQPGAVSAPGVGVGHAANGLPIGSPGSGPGSPEQPLK
jgi:hypothetical protein